MGLVHLVRLEQRRGPGRAPRRSEAFGGSSPTRRTTRSTWRSIGSSGRPKQNSRTTDAVFLPMPLICGQPVARLEGGHVAEELERVVAALLADRAAASPGAAAPSGSPGRPAGSTSISSGSGANSTARPVRRRPRPAARRRPSPAPGLWASTGSRARVGPPERLERDLGVRVGAVLGQDREDQLARRVEAALPDRVVRSSPASSSSTNGTSPGR